MYKLTDISENSIINSLIAGFDRSPDQLYKPHECDAEIIRIGDLILALTTDSISEEISTGLYDDPYFIGWMIVTVNISDLAAVAASPIGILISEIIPKNYSTEKLKQLQRGISDACRKYNIYVLGGDTNEGDNLLLTGTAIGKIDGEKYLTRIGCKNGDILYSTGKLGTGNAFALSNFISGTTPFPDYKPEARIRESQIISKYASCCMDTSDGLIATLDQLMRLNDIGFVLNSDWQKTISRRALKYAKNHDTPPWLLLAGQHGEFELIFTIPEMLQTSFLNDAWQNGFTPVESGKVIAEKVVKIPVYNEVVQIDTKFIRNLLNETNGDVKLYLKKLLEYDFQLKNGPYRNFTRH